MKVIIAGGRDLDKYHIYAKLVDLRIAEDPNLIEATEIVSGCATGADTAGEMYGDFYSVPVKKFPAKWLVYGKGAGPIRNEEMAQYADILIAFWDGKSTGTKNMIDEMRKLNKKVFFCPV